MSWWWGIRDGDGTLPCDGRVHNLQLDYESCVHGEVSWGDPGRSGNFQPRHHKNRIHDGSLWMSF